MRSLQKLKRGYYHVSIDEITTEPRQFEEGEHYKTYKGFGGRKYYENNLKFIYGRTEDGNA